MPLRANWLLAIFACSDAFLVERDASWVHCWEHGHTWEECCLQPDSQGNSCFDSIFTQKECCHGGWSRLYPTAKSESTSWEDAALWAQHRPLDVATVQWWNHPSFSREQRRWEAEAANSTVELTEEVLGHRIRLKVFKRSGPALAKVLEELDEDLYRLRRAWVPGAEEAPVAIDIGASVGIVAVLLAKLARGATVVAVEPAPANFRYLLWNIRINGVADSVFPFNLAIGSTPAAAQAFYYSPTYPTWSQASHDEDRPTEVAAESWRGGWTDWQVRFEIEVATFAEILAALGLQKVHFLKVDCEGCEWSIFEPVAWARLRHRVGHVATELHQWALPEDKQGTDELEAAVRESVCVHETKRENLLCTTI